MIISASFLKIQHEEDKILKLDKLTDYMHYDVMDGKFTENMTPSLCNFKIAKPKDVHLMVNDIKKYVDEYAKIKPDYITFHIEATNNVNEIIDYIKSKEIKVGLALNPETKVDDIIPYLKDIDLVLIMSVYPGKGGQTFIDITDKLNRLYLYRKENNLKYLLEVDGGINDETAKKLTKADILVSGSYITDSSNYEEKIKTLKQIFKNGFTLAELLAVIVILAIIAVITTMAVDRSIKNSHYNTCLTQERNIIEGAKAWSYDHSKELPNSGGSKVLNFTDLQNQGYIEDNLISPMTSEPYSTGTKITITSPSGTNNYDYTVTYGNTDEQCVK